ncbi:MAG TPA: bifunctional tetrahydrofolate synthase/dihydrofolate synthase [Gammaproteobacteria bacterium]
MRFSSLDAWLSWQETLHPSTIELGLERAGRVLDVMRLRHPHHVVITVAGTNGKGSSVAMLDAILRAAGYRVGTYTSPHLLRYNERIRINGEMIDDASLCAAFERVDQARGETSITYFEFGTLAAFDLFSRANLDCAILEVGMGGRLDAVNLLDADVALVATIDIDHAEWLGPDRETIAREKAGIFRSGRPAVCSDPNPPASLIDEAERVGARLHCLGREYDYRRHDQEWEWWSATARRDALPLPALRGASQLENAAGVLMALALIAQRLPVNQQQVRQGLLAVTLPGRFQVVPGPVTEIWDVAHNPESAQELAQTLRLMPCTGRTRAVVGMLADKDIEKVIAYLLPVVDHWYPATLSGPRGAPASRLLQAFTNLGVEGVQGYETVTAAHAAALGEAMADDRIVTFGSFFTVAEVMGHHV